MPLSRHLGLAGRMVGRGLVTLVLWTVWLGLSILLVAQVYIASSNQLEMPPFVIRAFEHRLAAAGMHATFGRTRFDPSGRVLIENVRVTLPGFDEPLVTARAVYARLDPWALTLQRFEPLELRVTDADLRVPAMFSPSGKSDDLIRDLDAVVLPRGAELDIASLNFHAGAMAVSAHGLVHLGGLQAGERVRVPFTQFLAQHYGPASREFAGLLSLLGVLDHPVLQLELEPSESHGAVVRATLRATGLRLSAPVELQAGNVRLMSAFPLLSPTASPIDFDMEAETVRLPRAAAELRGLRARLRAERPVGRAPLPGDAKTLDLTAADLVVQGVEIRAPSARVTPGSWPKVQADIQGRLLEEPLAAHAELDLAAQTAAVKWEGRLAPEILTVIGGRLHKDLRAFTNLSVPLVLAGDADLGPHWRFRRAGARFSTQRIDTWQHLPIDAVEGQLEFDGRRLLASHVLARFGENFARGSYEMDISTLRYRFLLEGRLRPLVISPWFPNQPWWGNLFRNFEFSSPPIASIDWQGQWPTDHETRLFLAVEAPQVAINGVAFDHLFTRLFVRPNFDDGLEVSLAQGTGSAAGTFARWYDKGADVMRRLDLDLSSTLATDSITKVWPPGVATLGAFAFDRAPAVKLTGRFDWPPAPEPPHKRLHLEGKTDAPFRFHGFPLDRMDFTAEVRDDSFVLEPLSVGFAGGTVTGRVEVQDLQKILLNTVLKDASLPRAIEIVQNYSPPGSPASPTKPAATGDFVRNLANVQLDLSVSAEGAYADALSYQGRGKAEVQGPELTRVPMLGLLSAVLPFTELRFTTARADFAINGAQLMIPNMSVLGAHSRIDARGMYTLDEHALNFNAIVYPLRESKSLPGQLFSAALAPFSQLTQVRLIGTLDKPKWILAAGPTNLLRNLFAPGSRAPASSGAAPSPLAHPAAAAASDSDSSNPPAP